MDDQSNSSAHGGDMSGGVIAEFHKRIHDLEKSHADLKAKLDAAQSQGAVEPYPGFAAHVAYVMLKYHAKDLPDATAPEGSQVGSG